MESNSNSKNNKKNSDSGNISITSKVVKNEKNPGDNLLKRKIIKIKEKNKASMTVSNTYNNSSLINNTVNHTNHSNYSNSNNISNFLPNSNYLNKIKNKISLECPSSSVLTHIVSFHTCFKSTIPEISYEKNVVESLKTITVSQSYP